jgi:hypothetical protein
LLFSRLFDLSENYSIPALNASGTEQRDAKNSVKYLLISNKSPANMGHWQGQTYLTKKVAPGAHALGGG